MKLKKIKKLIFLVKKNNISELKISSKKESIKIIYNNTNLNLLKEKNKIKKNNIPLINKNKKKYYPELKKKSFVKTKYHVIKSPIVGTFYIYSHHKNDSFIKLGQKINIGDTLCLIETMKVMNTIKSDYSGIIHAILVENEQLIEFDEPLIIISYDDNHVKKSFNCK